MTSANETSANLSALISVISALIAFLSFAGTLIIAWIQHKQNDLSRSARLDLAVQGVSGGDDPDADSTFVMVTNLGPATATEVMVSLLPEGGEEIGQGALRLGNGEVQTFTYPRVRAHELARVNLSFMDGRGKRRKREWTPKSKSWPLRPWLLRQIEERARSQGAAR